MMPIRLTKRTWLVGLVNTIRFMGLIGLMGLVSKGTPSSSGS